MKLPKKKRGRVSTVQPALRPPQPKPAKSRAPIPAPPERGLDQGTTREQIKAVSNLLVGLAGAALAYVGAQAWELLHGRGDDPVMMLADIFAALGIAMLVLVCGLFPLRKSNQDN